MAKTTDDLYLFSEAQEDYLAHHFAELEEEFAIRAEEEAEASDDDPPSNAPVALPLAA